MPSVTFVLSDGAKRVVEAASGSSVMHVAMTEDIPGIVAECGGNAMCATCHVYAEPETAHRLPPVSEIEDEMLESTASPRLDTSRLSCQVVLTDEQEDVAFTIPDAQL